MQDIHNLGIKEPTTISIPQLPLPYQPGGGGSVSSGGVGHINYLSSVDEILATEFTPPDRYFTVSAVLGRLKEPMKLPTNGAVVDETEQTIAKRKLMLIKQQVRTKIYQTVSMSDINGKYKAKSSDACEQALIDLAENPIYNEEHQDSTILLNLWKRISSHRTAAVFRKPVNPAEGEQYNILFV